MPPQGSNHNGPLSLKEGGLRMFDAVRPSRKSSEERTARLVITSAQLLAAVAGTTVFQLAPAPGGTLYYEFLYGSLIMKHGGTAYTGTGQISVAASAVVSPRMNLSANIALSTFDAATGDVWTNIPMLGVAAATLPTGINQPLSVVWQSGAPGASLTGGNGSMIVQVQYRIVDSSLT